MTASLCGPIEATPPVQVADSAWQAGHQVESFEIGDEQDDGDGTKQFVVTLKMKKPPGDQSVRYFVHGRDPVWVYREEDYKRMINMDNNPVPASSIEVRFSAIGQAAMTEFAPGSVPDVRGTRAATGPIWHRVWSALKLAQVRLRIPIVLVVAALVVGRWDLIRNYWDRLTRGTLSGKHRVSGRLGRHRVFLPDGPRRGLRLAGQVRDLQHGPGAPQAGRSRCAARRGRGADAAFAVPDSTGGNPDGPGDVSAARARVRIVRGS